MVLVVFVNLRKFDTDCIDALHHSTPMKIKTFKENFSNKRFSTDMQKIYTAKSNECGTIYIANLLNSCQNKIFPKSTAPLIYM